jgi:uncharacterized protein DUF1844
MAEEEPFKVTDRRRREDAAPEVPPVPSQAEPSVRPPAEPATSRVPPSLEGTSQGVPDLQGLFIMLASSALLNLGEAADPATGQRVFDLEQAREAIDLLVLLRAKTEGNRSEQESRLLEEILYDLQLRFVGAAQGGGRR